MSYKKEINDVLNWAKSELTEDKHNKMGKNLSPYREDKIKFLEKVVKKFGKLKDNL